MIAIEPERVPVAVGVKVTLIVQLAPAPSVLQVGLDCAKSPVAAPTVIVVLAVPVFFTVTALLALVVFSGRFRLARHVPSGCRVAEAVS